MIAKKCGAGTTHFRDLSPRFVWVHAWVAAENEQVVRRRIVGRRGEWPRDSGRPENSHGFDPTPVIPGRTGGRIAGGPAVDLGGIFHGGKG